MHFKHQDEEAEVDTSLHIELFILSIAMISVRGDMELDMFMSNAKTYLPKEPVEKEVEAMIEILSIFFQWKVLHFGQKNLIIGRVSTYLYCNQGKVSSASISYLKFVRQNDYLVRRT